MLYNDNYYIRPKEASRKLSMAYKIRTPVYMYGVTGSGKTALVKDFLAHKKYSVFSAAKISPEEINISKDGKEKIVVIDDLHFVTGISERKSYEELIIKLLEQRNVWLLLISRSQMPGWLMSIYIHYAFITIPESDFYFTREEQILFLKENNITLNKKQEDEVIKFTEGFPIAIRLLAINGGDLRTATQELCNYLESYVYDQWDIELQEFFMQTSIVDNFTEELASMITGKSNVAVLLARAQEMGNFFVSDGVNGIWEYRWQMRDSMRLRLKKKWNNERINPLYHHAGLYYEMHDKIPEALSMYEQCNDKESISRVLIANARKNPASGHYFEMRKYYLSLPEEKILENPLLIAGMSMLQSMLMNIDESERWYEALKDFAKNHICSERREAKSRLLYLDIGLPHRGIVNLVDILKHAGTLIKDRGATLPEFSVTSNLPSMMNGGKDFCDWSKHDNELAASIGKMVEFVLGKYGKGLVSLALAESYLEKGMDGYRVMTLAENRADDHAGQQRVPHPPPPAGKSSYPAVLLPLSLFCQFFYPGKDITDGKHCRKGHLTASFQQPPGRFQKHENACQTHGGSHVIPRAEVFRPEKDPVHDDRPEDGITETGQTAVKNQQKQPARAGRSIGQLPLSQKTKPTSRHDGYMQSGD